MKPKRACPHCHRRGGWYFTAWGASWWQRCSWCMGTRVVSERRIEYRVTNSRDATLYAPTEGNARERASAQAAFLRNAYPDSGPFPGS